VIDIDNVWSQTLSLLNTHLEKDTLIQLRTDCTISAIETFDGETLITIAVRQMDTLNLVRHKLSRHLVTYTGLVVEKPVQIKLVYTGDGSPAMRHFLKVLTAHHILSSRWPEPAWAIPDLLPAGLTLLAGRQKVGKSWLAMQLCRAITYGQTLWERDVPPGSFLYLALEDHPRRLQSRMQKQQWPINDGLKSSGFILRDQFEEQIGYLDKEGSNILAEQIERQKPRVVVVDTLGRAVRGDVNDYDVMTAALSPIQQVALTKNTAIIIIDHHRKLFGGDIDVVVDVLGSTAKAAVADTIWGLYRQRGTKTVRLGMVGRDVEDQQISLKMDDCGLWQLSDEGDGLEMTPRRQEILDALTDLGQATLADISAAIDQNRGNTYTRLADLIDAGLIRRQVVAGKATTYQLNGSTPDGDSVAVSQR
jgi:hypothetical protein